MRSKSRPRRRLRSIATFVMFIVGLLPAVPALGQGTDGLVPDPITSGELQRYAIRLGLSEHQRRAAELAHDQYKTEFRKLREADIAELMSIMRSMFGSVPDRAQFDDFVQRIEVIHKKVVKLDARLFDQIGPLLSDEQKAVLPQVREARERRRYTISELTWMMGNKPADLSDLLLDIELTPEEQELIETPLRQYERQLTAHMRKLFETNAELMSRLMDALEERGITKEALEEDPTRMMEMAETAQEVIFELTRESTELTFEVLEFNRKQFHRIAGLLSFDHRHELRRGLLNTTYGGLSTSLNWNFEPFARALEWESFSGAQRDAIVALRDQARDDVDRLTKDSTARADEINAAIDPTDDETRTKRAEVMSELTAAIKARRAEIDEQFTALIGQENLTRFGTPGGGVVAQQVDGDAATVAAREAVAEAVAAAAASNADVFDVGHGPDMFIAPKISRGELKGYADVMELSEDQRAVLDGLYEQYEERFATLDEQLNGFTEINRAVWDRAGDPDDTDWSRLLEAVERLYEARQRTAADVLAMDDGLFDEIAAVFSDVDPARVKRARHIRHRIIFSRGYVGWVATGGESRLDLQALVRRMRLHDTTMKRLQPALDEHLASAVDVLRTRFDRALLAQRAFDRLSIELQRLQDEGTFNPMAWRELQEQIVGDAGKNLQQSAGAIQEINDRALERVVGLLDVRSGQELRDTWNRTAYPAVFQDEKAIGDKLTLALELDDLNGEQRTALADLSAEYRVAYDKCSQDMIAQSRASINPMLGGPDSWADYQAQQNTISKIRFERDELNVRSIVRLLTVLNDEQIKRIGGLPDPSSV